MHQEERIHWMTSHLLPQPKRPAKPPSPKGSGLNCHLQSRPSHGLWSCLWGPQCPGDHLSPGATKSSRAHVYIMHLEGFSWEFAIRKEMENILLESSSGTRTLTPFLHSSEFYFSPQAALPLRLISLWLSLHVFDPRAVFPSHSLSCSDN